MISNLHFRVIIAGSRGFADFAALCAYIDKILSRKAQEKQITILSGHCSGPDRMGEEYARLKGYSIEIHPANWKQYGKSAGPRRNKEMALCADALIAFWNGNSRGTQNMIEEARAAGIPIRIYRY